MANGIPKNGKQIKQKKNTRTKLKEQVLIKQHFDENIRNGKYLLYIYLLC